MLKKETQKMLIRRFPKIELSYNKNIYKKVHADYYMLIPKGPKVFLWFTYIHKKNVCLLVRLDYKGEIINIERYAMCFNTELSYGTVLHGTLLKVNQKSIFCCEDIYIYKGKFTGKYTPIKKLELYNNLFSCEVSQRSYGTQFIIPVMACISQNYETLFESIKDLPYKVYGIRYIRRSNVVGIEKIQIEVKKETVFKVKASLQSDIYHLYSLNQSSKIQNIKDNGNKDNDNKNYVGIAMIPSYKRSVMMNSLFRNIKENKNLDLLEESDSDDEFENTALDKFVSLDKEIYMKCVHNKKFNMWEPIEVTNPKI